MLDQQLGTLHKIDLRFLHVCENCVASSFTKSSTIGEQDLSFVLSQLLITCYTCWIIQRCIDLRGGARSCLIYHTLYKSMEGLPVSEQKWGENAWVECRWEWGGNRRRRRENAKYEKLLKKGKIVSTGSKTKIYPYCLYWPFGTHSP